MRPLASVSPKRTRLSNTNGVTGILCYDTTGISRMRLSEKYTLERGSVYLTGIQALVRLPMDQMRRDRRAGLKTAAFISGYEGSPLGGYDQQLARTKDLLDEHRIHFHPALNED